MDEHTDALTAIAEQIYALWTACGGFGPPHEFNVNRWAKGAATITEEHDLTPAQWREAHQLAVRMGARRGGLVGSQARCTARRRRSRRWGRRCRRRRSSAGWCLCPRSVRCSR